MNQTTLAVLGIVSGVTNIAGLVPYLRDILRRKTKPERGTWWIWTALNVIAFFAQLAAGARWSLCLTAGQLVTTITVAVLSVSHGYGRFRRRDLFSLLLAMLGLLLWKFTRDPLVAIVIVVVVDLLGFWLTLYKSWGAPRTETLSTWVICTVSGLAGVLAVGELNFTKLLYPAYIFTGNALLVSVITYRRLRVKA